MKNFKIKTVLSHINKKILLAVILVGVLGLMRFVWAQDFGLGEVNEGLGGSLTDTDPRELAGRIINITLGFLGLVALAIVVYAGFLWMASGGDEEKISTARKLLQNGVIGLVIILSAWGIATFVLNRLGGDGGAFGGEGICQPGDVRSCGCDNTGTMVCVAGDFGRGSWGPCVGQSCNPWNPPGANCDGSLTLPGCQATNQICSPNQYCSVDSCTCQPKGGLGDSCNADPNAATCSSDDGLCAEYLFCNPDKNCTCDGPPVITSINPVGGFCEESDPNIYLVNTKACSSDDDCDTTCNLDTPNGAANNFLTIFGHNFGEYSSGLSRVVFEGDGTPGGPAVNANQPSSLNPACVSSWSDSQIIIAIPSFAFSGQISVMTQDGRSDSTGDSHGPSIANFQMNNLVRPGLCQLDPDRGGLGSTIKYYGINLYNGQAYFGNYQNNIRAIESNFEDHLLGDVITPNILTGQADSFVQRRSPEQVLNSNYLRFTKDPEAGESPFISSFAPITGAGGQYVTIRGRGFGNARGGARVLFGDSEANYDFPEACLHSVWRDQQIIVKVPARITDGDYTIQVVLNDLTLDTSQLNPNVFQVNNSEALKSSICKIEPDRGPIATPVAVWGEYFGANNGSGLLKFNYDKNATGTIQVEGRAQKINTIVPGGAITGPVRVINNGGWGNEINFAVGACKADAECGMQVCCPANTYKAGRCSDTLANCFIDIPNSVFQWRFNTGFATSSTSTPPCIGPHCDPNDPCTNISDFDSCQASPSCCFDNRTSVCRGGAQINSGIDSGYCAYYNCQGEDSRVGGVCNSAAPVKDGRYNDINTCDYYCANPPAGPGLSCAGYLDPTCRQDTCNFPGSACLLESGATGTFPPSCGTCCCVPGTQNPFNTNLTCIADRGACSGASRGLYCGCSQDQECGSPETVGCGASTCCQARPSIEGTNPNHLDNSVCRNAAMQVDFNQNMDISTFSNNILLLEEREYGNGVCPEGTFIVQGEDIKDLLAHQETSGQEGFSLGNWLARFKNNFISFVGRLSGRLSVDQALADLPNPNKLYCAIPGSVSGLHQGERSSLSFVPQKILAPATNYYLVIKGDEELNSQAGIMSISRVGMNGQGYHNVTSDSYTEGEFIFFNGRSYKNSHIIKFSTLSDQGPSAGICMIDYIDSQPSSYLFKTADNSLDENDDNFNHPTFDTKADRDKMFSAIAYSANGQILRPVSGYFWDWDFALSNTDVATIRNRQQINALPVSSVVVEAKTGISDGETKLQSGINMNRFVGASCTAAPCSCSGQNCSNNCCNVYMGGDGFNKASDLYVFLCNNPWPPVSASGLWSPWADNCDGAVGGDCALYNYKFHYCRDAGTAGTLDDLPAIINQAVTRGLSTNIICSSDRSPCPSGSVANLTRCGLDQNADGQPDGICIWDVLKESYFFRESLPVAGEIISATDLGTGGRVRVNWRSAAPPSSGGGGGGGGQIPLEPGSVALRGGTTSSTISYKIYYSRFGSGVMLFKEVKADSVIGGVPVCSQNNGMYNCSAVIEGLSNGLPHTFRVSVISIQRTESALSATMTATPTDQTAPAVPVGLQAEIVGGVSLRFSWTSNTDDARIYRLYRGLSPNLYGEAFDSLPRNTSLIFPANQFAGGENYFALSALDAYGNESAKSAILSCLGVGADTVCGPISGGTGGGGVGSGGDVGSGTDVRSSTSTDVRSGNNQGQGQGAGLGQNQGQGQGQGQGTGLGQGQGQGQGTGLGINSGSGNSTNVQD